MCTLGFRERKLWQQYAVGKYNSSPQGAGKVLAAIEPGLVEQFNATLSHQWEVYSYAVGLYKHRYDSVHFTRCREREACAVENLVCTPRLGRLASRCGGCGSVGQTTETIVGRKKRNSVRVLFVSSRP